MNPDHPTPTTSDEAAFDHAARAVHAQALDHLSAPTVARLRAARTAAASAGVRRAPRHGLGWALAGSVAAVLALAIGVQWRAAPGLDAQAPAAVATTAADPADDLLAALDETPDFYLWLASADALPAQEL